MSTDPPFTDVLAEADLPEGKMAIVKVNGRQVAVIRRGGKLHALDNNCPHVGGPLGQGSLAGNTVVCPWHQMAFDLETGLCTNRAGGFSVKVYEVKVENGIILVR